MLKNFDFFSIFVPLQLFSFSQAAINALSKRKGFIIDTRTLPTIQNARSKGGGQELEANYPGWKKINRGIDRSAH